MAVWPAERESLLSQPAGRRSERVGQQNEIYVPVPAARLARSQPYELYLMMKREDGETIRFANASAGDMVHLGALFGWEL